MSHDITASKVSQSGKSLTLIHQLRADKFCPNISMTSHLSTQRVARASCSVSRAPAQGLTPVRKASEQDATSVNSEVFLFEQEKAAGMNTFLLHVCTDNSTKPTRR